MRPVKIVYLCEECGREFSRDVREVVVDSADHCEVFVKLLPIEGTDEIEEFPMCECLRTPSRE